MLGSLEVRLSFPCEACDSGIPVNGPVPLVKCARCLEVTRLEGARGWDKLLEKRVFVAAARNGRPGETTRSESKHLNLTTTVRFPPCAACGKQHDHRRMKLAMMKRQPVTCGCGVELVLQHVPAAFAATHPWVKGFVDADIFDESGAPHAAAVTGAPVVTACMKCQASLPIDGTRRLVECSYCSARNYLPDDLWLALHPALKRESWFVIFDTDDVLSSIGM